MSNKYVKGFKLEPEPKLTQEQLAARRRAMKAEYGITPYAYDARTTELLTMLRTMRPSGTQTEHEFVAQWVAPLGTEADAFGNHWLTIGDSPILWSCHTDTVHLKGGAQYVGFQDGCAYVAHSSCLGADDTTGVWLMRQMILARVPGTYVFHRSEEVGGLGSSWILKNTPERLAGLDFAIAFDRMGYDDIITTQGNDTASEKFADTLASALCPLGYFAADGIFTDTANYAETISECSNISVGYHHQHSPDEWQDVDFAMLLCDRLLGADFSGLTAHRDHTAPPSWGRYTSAMWDRWESKYDDVKPGHGLDTMDDVCRNHPLIVSDFLTACGFTVDEIMEYGGLTPDR